MVWLASVQADSTYAVLQYWKKGSIPMHLADSVCKLVVGSGIAEVAPSCEVVAASAVAAAGLEVVQA